MLYDRIPGYGNVAELLLYERDDGSFWGHNLMKLTGQIPVQGGVYAGDLRYFLQG